MLFSQHVKYNYTRNWILISKNSQNAIKSSDMKNMRKISWEDKHRVWKMGCVEW